MTSPFVLVPREKFVTSTSSFSLAPLRMEACTAAPYETTSSGFTESQIFLLPKRSASKALICSNQITFNEYTSEANATFVETLLNGHKQ